jgi:hypothetical protein
VTRAALVPISLPADPTLPLQAATKQYVDIDQIRELNLRTGPGLAVTPANWTERMVSTEDAVCTGTTLTMEHGIAIWRGTGGAGQRSNRRAFYQFPGTTPGGYSRIRSLWRGHPVNPAVANTLNQHGHAHGIQQVGGRWTAVVVTHDITFGPTVINLSIWKQETGPGVGGEFTLGSYLDQVAVSASVRTSNVVTLTVPSGHGFNRGDAIAVDLANASYDGNFEVSSVTATTIVYNHTGANLTTSTGTVRLLRRTNVIDQLTRSTNFTACTRTSGIVTATVAAGHPWRRGDEIAVDGSVASYDGIFKVTDLPSTTQIRWNQAGTDDATANTGTISNTFPYWMESEWWPGMLRVRTWPAMIGARAETPPSWESDWAEAVSLTGLATPEPDPTLGLGCGLVVAHPSSGAAPFKAEHRYSDISYAELV